MDKIDKGKLIKAENIIYDIFCDNRDRKFCIYEK